MQALLLYALKTIIYSAIFFGYYCLALRNKRFHYYNRFYLLMTVLLSLSLPFVHKPSCCDDIDLCGHST